MSPRSNPKTALGQQLGCFKKKKHVTSIGCKLEPAIQSRDTGQQIPCFDRCQLLTTWKYMVKQGSRSLPAYYSEFGRHDEQLRRRSRRHHRAYAPTRNTASHDTHEKINSWVSSSFLYEYGPPLGGPSARPPELRYDSYGPAPNFLGKP